MNSAAYKGIGANDLNTIAKMLGTTDKNVVFSACIKVLREEGGYDIKDALEIVLGEGRYDELIGNLYDALRGSK